MNLQESLALVIERQNLTRAQMIEVMHQIMQGETSPVHLAAWLTAMRMKGETCEELTAAALVMRELATPMVLDIPHLVDTCGTGGDESHLFNVSTASAFVAAAAGVKVAKHGNRSVSSSCGSADVLEKAGAHLDLRPEQIARVIEHVGVGFLFAPQFHQCMKHAAPVRRELGIRTLFNLLGPLTNPAQVKHQVLGVYDARWCASLVQVLADLGSHHVLVVHGHGGVDEFSITGPTQVSEWRHREFQHYSITPESMGLVSAISLKGLTVSNAEESLNVISDAFKKRVMPDADSAVAIIALNAGAAIYAADASLTLKDGVAMAMDAIYCGAAYEKWDEFITFTQMLRDFK